MGAAPACRGDLGVIGLVDVGGTKLLAAVTAAPGAAVEHVVRRPTPDHDPGRTLLEMLDESRRGRPLSAVAIALPGPFDREAGRLLSPPNLPASWRGLDLRGIVMARHGCPVLIENDANCAALAEAVCGAAAGLDTVVYLTISTGVGGGIVSRGRLVIGRHDTEGGHVVVWPPWLGGPPCYCGGAGCLEALVSGTSIRRRFGVRAELLEDPAAWADVGRWLGAGITACIALHDPDAVVLGGGVVASADRFWPSMTATVEALVRLQPIPRLLRAALGDDRNLVGAALLVEEPTGGGSVAAR